MTERDHAPAAARPRLMERYRAVPAGHRRDPGADPRRGVHAAGPCRAARAPRSGCAEPVPQGRGPEPDRLVQGSGDGRSPWPRPPRPVRGPSSAPRPATPRPPPRPTARPPGWRSSWSCRRARSRSASCSRRSIAGARVVAIDGNFDQALGIVRALAEQDDHPVTLVNSVNPFRLEGQKTAAFEICDDLGRAPDVLAIPVGNAGNISAYWAGFRDYADGRRSWRHAPRCGASRRPAPRRSWSATGSSTRTPSRPRSGSATRRRGTRRSTRATHSGGRITAVTDDEILAAYRALARLRGHLLRAGLGRQRRRHHAGRRRPASSTPTRPSSAS